MIRRCRLRRMSTPGYDPLQVLWHLFNGDDYVTARLPLLGPQRERIGSIVASVTENRMHAEGTSLVGRFMKAIEGAGGKPLDVDKADLAQGLLECLNPYQSGEPYTHPRSLTASKIGSIYDHFKGGVYAVRDFSSWASGEGEPVVEYLSMIHGTKHTRLASQWCEVVQWPDGKYRSRFVYRGPTLQTPEPAYKVPSPSPR
jgi:hypothetical protein